MYSFKTMTVTSDALDDDQNEYYQREVNFYQPETFYNLGRNICISILDVWHKNPYTRVTDANEQRKEIAERQAKLDRFKKEQAGIKAKQKRIVELIKTQFYAGWYKRNVFQIPNNEAYKKTTMDRFNHEKNKWTEKSITTTEVPKHSLTVSANPRQVRNQFVSKKSVVKEVVKEKKIGLIQPQIESTKNLKNGEQAHSSMAFKNHIESRGLFKPLNLRIRNVNMGLGNR